MRFVVTFFCCLLGGIGLHAQIQEVAPEGNPRLYRHSNPTLTEPVRSYTLLSPAAVQRVVDTNALTIVRAGESAEICIDTAALDGTFSLLTNLGCQPLTAGSVVVDEICFTYTADPSVIVDTDTLCMRVCYETGECDTLIYPLLITRPDAVTTLPDIFVDAFGTASFCVDTLGATGSVISVDALSCDGDDLGTASITDAICVAYTAAAFAGTDTVCVTVCDINGVCDVTQVALRVQRDTLDVPFMDDFSYGGPYPRSDYWLTNDVYVNETFAVRPPSIGVATFDGIDATGSPYTGGDGFSDELVSTYFGLGGFDTSDDVYLSFFYQARGLGDKPEQKDSLVLEFKSPTGSWVRIDQYQGIDPDVFGSDSIPEFAFVRYALPQEYLYDGFQFRMRNKSSRRGMNDLWHVDYIRLTVDEVPSELFADVAFTAPTSPPLKRYTAMPFFQFKGFVAQELRDSFVLPIFNHFNTTQEVQVPRIYIFADDVQIIADFLFKSEDPILPFGNVPAQQHIDALYVADEDAALGITTGLNNYIPTVDSVQGMQLTSLASFEQTSQNANLPLVFVNDSTSFTAQLRDYYAYDDGTAESNLVAQNVGTQIAQRYETNKDDTLRAIQVHIPRINVDVSSQLFNLQVYVGELDGTPEFERTFVRPIYVDELFDSLQGFTTYVLQDDITDSLTPLAIPAGEFWVGWQQGTITDDPIPFGFDKNRDNTANLRFSTNNSGVWQEFPSYITGTAMIRPVMGSRTPAETGTVAIEPVRALPDPLRIYPNPASERIYIDLGSGDRTAYTYQLFTLTGQSLRRGRADATIDVSDLVDGLYILQVVHTPSGARHSERVVVR